MTRADDQRTWIDRLMAHFRVNQTQLASKAGIAPSTLSKFMAEARPGHELTGRTIERIEAAFGVMLGFDPDDDTGRIVGFGEAEATPFDTVEAKDRLVARAAQALCEGRNAADPWIIRKPVLIDVGILPGDIVVVDLNEKPEKGDIVCAQLYGKGGQAETVFRIFQPPFFLLGAGPSARVPIMADDRGAQIRGVVIGSFRPRGVAAAVA